MKTTNFKRVLTLVLALALMFSLSMAAFAYDGHVEIIVRTSSYDLTTHQYSYTQIADLTNVGINTDDTVKDAINREFVANWSGSYLHYLTVGNTTYGTIRYTPYPGSFNANGIYLGGDPLIDSLNQTTEFSTYGGIYISAEVMMQDQAWDGYFFMFNQQYACSITHDWIYEVSTDGGQTFYRPLNNQGYLATMDEHVPVNGEIIRLTYGLVWEIFPFNG
jgi:hypothetical protein